MLYHLVSRPNYNEHLASLRNTLLIICTQYHNRIVSVLETIDGLMTEPRAEQSSTVGDDCAEDKDKPLSHCDAMLLVKNGIQELLSDPILSDLDGDISVEELQDVLHLEQGKAITLYLRRFDDSILRECASHLH